MNRRPEEVAKELGFLIKVLWSGQYRSVSPVDFKAVIGRFATQFAGTKQQDAHEFLMFFMDGIHEDTNRVWFISFLLFLSWVFWTRFGC